MGALVDTRITLDEAHEYNVPEGTHRRKLLAYWTAKGASVNPQSRAAAKRARKARRKNRK